MIARRLSCICCALLALFLAGAESWGEERTKKLIYYGWGIRDTEYIREHWQEMESVPFDGVGIVIAVDREAWRRGMRSTKNQLAWRVMGERAFRVEEFREAVAELKSARWRRFTDNFLPVALSGSDAAGGLHWFDDERWRIVANNFGVLARIGAESGAKGLIIDPEHYGFNLFSYSDQRQYVDKSFGEFAETARRRGRQVMTEITRSFPGVVLLSLFGHSLPLSELRRGASLSAVQYGLLPGFYDGILEAMPPGAHLVDGYEFAYPFKQRRQFLEGHDRIRRAVTLSAVPDHYRAKVKAGFGLMLDYGNRLNYFAPNELLEALNHALEISDEYVWLYSQGPHFFPPSLVASSYIEAIAQTRRSPKP